MCGDDFQTGGFADDGQIALGSVLSKVTGPELHVLFINQTHEDDLGMLRPRSRSGDVEEGLEEGRHRTLGVAGATAIDATIPHHRRQLQRVGRLTHGVHVRSQKDPMSHLTAWRQSNQEVGAPGNHRLRFHIQALTTSR